MKSAIKIDFMFAPKGMGGIALAHAAAEGKHHSDKTQSLPHYDCLSTS